MARACVASRRWFNRRVVTSDTPAWLGVDWGTSTLRVWAVADSQKVLQSAESDQGMSALQPGAFEAALLSLVSQWLPSKCVMPVIACGMVGARQGWVEAPYVSVPCKPLNAGSMVTAATHDPRLHVRVVPGLSQADPPDVMRGEETQIAGYLATHADFVGVLCLPGTHTKWVRVDRGSVLGFSTFMSGELFAILSTHSTLRYGMSCDGWNESMFLEQLARTLKQPEMLTASLFGIRARSLLQELPGGSAQAALSGLLLGIELAGTRSLWHDSHTVIIGKDTLAERYATALASQGASATTHSGEELVLTGLARMFSTVYGNGNGN